VSREGHSSAVSDDVDGNHAVTRFAGLHMSHVVPQVDRFSQIAFHGT
jgi:hypothetical protein